MVFAYAAEALAALPVNNSQAFDSSPHGKGGPLQPHLEFNGGMKGEQVRDYLSTELEAFRQDQAEVLKAFKQEVVHLRDKEISNQGTHTQLGTVKNKQGHSQDVALLLLLTSFPLADGLRLALPSVALPIP